MDAKTLIRNLAIEKNITHASLCEKIGRKAANSNNMDVLLCRGNKIGVRTFKKMMDAFNCSIILSSTRKEIPDSFYDEMHRVSIGNLIVSFEMIGINIIIVNGKEKINLTV